MDLPRMLKKGARLQVGVILDFWGPMNPERGATQGRYCSLGALACIAVYLAREYLGCLE